MKASDWIFKGGLLLIGAIFVAVYFLSSQNGRYEIIDSNTYSMLDTRNGIIIHMVAGKPVSNIAHIDLPRGVFWASPLKNKSIHSDGATPAATSETDDFLKTQ